MSLVLTNAGEKLEIVSTVVIPFTVHYADYVGATPVFTPGVTGGDTINGTKDLLAAPGSGQRVVRTVSVHNDSGGADTITIQLDDGGINYTIVTVVLPDNYALYYDEDGWKVLDKNGALATTLFTHALLGPHHSDTVTDTPTRGSMIAVSTWLAWDELVIGGAHQILKVNAGGTDPAWVSFDWDDMAAGAAADMVHSHGSVAEGGVSLGPLTSLQMIDGGVIGTPADLRIEFDYTTGDLKLYLGDTAGADEVQILDSGAGVVLRIDSNGNIIVVDGAWQGIGAALERIVFDAAGYISIMGAKFGIGIAAPDKLVHAYSGTTDDILKVATARNIANTAPFTIHANRGIGNVTNADQLTLFGGYSDSDTTVDAIRTKVIQVNEDVTHAARTAGLLFRTMSGGGVQDAVTILGNSYFGIACTPNSPFEINLVTENFEIVNAGSVGATEQDWVEVEIGGVQGYIRIFAAK